MSPIMNLDLVEENKKRERENQRKSLERRKKATKIKN